MSKRLILCEGPDDLNALRAIAQHLRWAEPVRNVVAGAGQERRLSLAVGGDTRAEIIVPSKLSGAAGEGKSALPRSCAEVLHGLRPQGDPDDETFLSVLGVVFDPDESAVADFHLEIEREIARRSPEWRVSPTGTPGVWSARRDADETMELRAVHWRARGEVLDGLPDTVNLDRLLCVVLAEAYPEEQGHVEGWIAEINRRRDIAGRKPATWKAAIHVWLANIYDKIDEQNAATRFLHQHESCKPHIEPILAQLGLVTDLFPLIGPA